MNPIIKFASSSSAFILLDISRLQALRIKLHVSILPVTVFNIISFFIFFALSYIPTPFTFLLKRFTIPYPSVTQSSSRKAMFLWLSYF